MKKIGILIRALSAGGAEKQSLLLAKNLKQRYDVYLFVQKKSPQEPQHLDLIKNENIQLVFLPKGFLSRARYLIAYIKKYQINVLFAYLTSDNVLAAVCGIYNKGLIVMGGIRNSRLPKHKFFITWLLQRYFMDYIIINNRSGRDFFVKKGYSPRKLRVIHNCFTSVDTRYRKTKNDTINILTVGRFVPQKDYYTALNAYMYLRKTHPELKLQYTIVGHGPQEEGIRDYIKKNKIPDVTISVNPAKLYKYYINSDIYLCSSIFEGLSNTIMEALYFSLPVIATKVGDNDLLVQHDRNGFLCSPKDYEAIGKYLIKLAKDHQLRKAFGARGNHILHEKFSETAFRNNYLNLLNEVLS